MPDPTRLHLDDRLSFLSMQNRSRRIGRIAVAATLLLTASCAASGAAVTTTASSSSAINSAAIPLGDGHVSTSPRVGYVDSCQTHFPTVGGAEKAGPWINTAKKTWNANTKIHVRGSVRWPSASYKVTISGNRRIVKTNGLPINHTTGTFPIASSDPAYAYDKNPNTIKATSVTWSLPKNPTKASTRSCTAMGAIGVLNDGELLFNALDGEGRDAVAHELLGSCDDHPMMSGTLHHHDVPSCIVSKAKGRSTLVGYAVDGFGIYVERDAKGQLLTNRDLDACHGRVSNVLWNGKTRNIFHYDATIEYPYTIGCFEGTKAARATG
jgi:YHYH protein